MNKLLQGWWLRRSWGGLCVLALVISGPASAQAPEKPAEASAPAPAAAPAAAAAPTQPAPAPAAEAAVPPPEPGNKPVQAPTSTVKPQARPDMTAVMSRWSAKHLVMLYRRETDKAPGRLEPLVQTSTMALEQQFLNHQYQVLQASPEALQAMDQGPGVVVTFAPDAGLSMIYSVYGDVRPQPGVAVGIAEVRIEARVFVGASLLSAEQGRGQVQTRLDPATREYGERRGFEIAAQQAATDLVKRIDERLRRLTPQQVEQMVAGDTSTSTVFSVVEPPKAPVAPAAAPALPPAAQVPAPPPGGAAAPATPTEPSATPASRRWLLSVGVSDYSKRSGNTDANLEGVAYDIQHVREVLRMFGFSSNSTRELFNESATVSAVRGSLTELASAVGPQDTVVMYISGHGSPKPFGRTGITMPVLYDSSSSNLIDYEEIMRLFARIPARERIMLVDTCFAGGAAAGLNAVSVGGNGATVTRAGGAPDLRLMMRNVKDAPGDIAVMSAARTDEKALDLGPPKGGLFTLSLLAGLLDTKGQATLEEVYRQHVWTTVTGHCAQVRARGRECQQSPVLGYQGAGNSIRLAGP